MTNLRFVRALLGASGRVSTRLQHPPEPIQRDLSRFDRDSRSKEGDSISSFIERNVTEELLGAYPDIKVEEAFFGTLASAAEEAGRKFIFILDEWDALIRELHSRPAELEYLEFLRSLFKNSGVTPKIVAAAYMTGILPIKKDGSQSAISDFEEYTMLSPAQFVPYFGFTEKEVSHICERHLCNFEQMKQWYDGYRLGDAGSGFADIVYLPKRNSGYPALFIALKWKQSADSAITQIRERNYPQSLRNCGGRILLVGISYNRDAPAGRRRHTCVIEELL